MLKTTKINIELSTIETLNLKRFLGSKGIIDKDLNIAIKKYIQKNMQEEKKKKENKELVKLPPLFTIYGEEKEKYTFEREKIILIEFLYSENPDTITINVKYLDENDIVKNICICNGNYVKTSWKIRDDLINQMKNIENISIRTWESDNSNEHDEIFISVKHLKSVSVDKKKSKIHIYGPNGYMYLTLFTPNNKKHFKEAIKKLKNYIK